MNDILVYTVRSYNVYQNPIFIISLNCIILSPNPISEDCAFSMFPQSLTKCIKSEGVACSLVILASLMTPVSLSLRQVSNRSNLYAGQGPFSSHIHLKVMLVDNSFSLDEASPFQKSLFCVRSQFGFLLEEPNFTNVALPSFTSYSTFYSLFVFCSFVKTF